MPQTLLARTARTLSCRRGVAAAEYAVLAVGLIIVVGAAVYAFQGVLTNAFANIGTTLTTTQSSISTR